MNSTVPQSIHRYRQNALQRLTRLPRSLGDRLAHRLPVQTFSSLTLLVAATVSLLASCNAATAGQYNAILTIGDKAPQWENLEGVDGKRHSWGDIAGAKSVVVAFTCNSCPYARDVEDRLIELTKEFPESEMRLVAINVNVVKDDSLDAMKQRAQEKAFPYPYLHDPSQKIAKDYGAIKTPEFYVLDSSGKVVYMGALDDSPDGKSVTKRYVADAIRAAISGTNPETTETVPIGCRVRYTAARGGR